MPAKPRLEASRVRQLLQLAQDVQTKRPCRDQHQLFYIEGVRHFIQAVEQGFELELILHAPPLCTSGPVRQLLRRLRAQGAPILEVSPEQYRRLSTAERASGIAVLARQRWHTLSEIDLSQPCCYLVLEEVQSAGNLGTLIRSSEALGGTGLIILGQQIELYSPGTVRPSMGALFRQRFIRASFAEFAAWVGQNGVSVLGASPDGVRAFDRFEYPQATFLLLGEERAGLTERQRSLCTQLLTIPMVGQGDSLNLGVAGSLLLYQANRERRLSRPST